MQSIICLLFISHLLSLSAKCNKWLWKSYFFSIKNSWQRFLTTNFLKKNIFGYEVIETVSRSESRESQFISPCCWWVINGQKLTVFCHSYFSVTNTWSILQTSGALVQGGYGHSSVYDPNTRSIYIHGGYKAFSANKYRLADDLYKYEVDSRMW